MLLYTLIQLCCFALILVGLVLFLRDLLWAIGRDPRSRLTTWPRGLGLLAAGALASILVWWFW
jgi:hypothetical protein